jgi:signal transduction histidine kinase/DNA-binding response OmpR family regulator
MFLPAQAANTPDGAHAPHCGAGTMNSMHGNSGSSLDQSEIRFLVERNADGILVVDEDGVVLFANPAAEQIFGRPPRSLVGSPIGVPVTAGETAEIAIHKPDGGQIEAEVRVVETSWNHRPARLASLRDISARKAMEERLSHAAKMEAVGRLTAGIAHDFNNLLTVVLGNLESAQRKRAVDEAAVSLALENAAHGARRAAGLTEKLLAFARRKPLEPRTIDVNALVSGMSDLLQRTLGESIEVRTTPSPDLWLVDVDPTELEAAILNLAVNARDAMPSGGELWIETENIQLDFGQAAAHVSLKPGAYVLVSVTDTGIGMAPEVLKQVFEPFFTTKGGRGTGLGLSQVYGFANQSGGGVALHSDPGIGTTARIYLPKAEAVAAASQESTATNAVAPRGRPGETILVVEDDQDVRSYTVGSLRDLGYGVVEAADAASALEVLSREPAVRLLFTDLGLPGGVDGKVLSERARRLRPSLRVLITTAYAASALIHDGRLDAGIELLAKPFTFEALAARIRDVLDRFGGEAREPRILVVEDEVLVRMLLAQTLEELGCRVEEAGTGQEALSKFADTGEALSAAIVDLGLPDQPGDEVIARMRSARPHLPIVLATGYVDQTLRQRWSDEPLFQILGKPFQPSEIKAALEGVGIHVQRTRET